MTLRHHNQTPMVLECHELTDRDGREVLVAIAKITWTVSSLGETRLSSPQASIRETDTLATSSRWSSVLAPSDVYDAKPGTDVLLIGFAHPPPGNPALVSEVSVRVEAGDHTLYKRVLAHGPRVWQLGTIGVVPGPAAALVKTPLTYEHTFGGVDDRDPDCLLIDRRNPAGRGVAADRTRLVGERVPELEDPAAPLGSSRPAPACFAPVPAAWEPRLAWAGTYDDAWRKGRAPLRPRDFNPRHSSVAQPGLWSEAPLIGDEPVEVLGATPEGVWRFRLPRYRPSFRVTIGGEATSWTTHLDTFLIDAEERRVELSWRIAVPIPKKAEMVEHILLSARDRLPDGALSIVSR